jgi:hypothetical protein
MKLAAEGILNDSLTFREEFNVGEHLFEIHPMLQYSALSELREFLEDTASAFRNSIDSRSSSTSHLEALQRSVNNEKLMNENTMKIRVGTEIKSNDILQLYHVRSCKYIKCLHSLAHFENDNFAVTLDSDGSNQSWLRMNPVKLTDEIILDRSEVNIAVSERRSEYLHFSEKLKQAIPAIREVNVAFQTSSSWRIDRYRSFAESSSDGEEYKSCLSGQMIYLADAESKCILSALREPPSIDLFRAQAEGDDSGVVKDGFDGYEDDDADDASSISSNSTIDNFRSHIESFGRIIFKNSDQMLSTNMLWTFVTDESHSSGATIMWKRQKLYLRHVNTGKYLSLKMRSEFDDGAILELVDKISDSGLFRIELGNRSGSTIDESNAIHLCVGKHYIERGTYSSDLECYSAVGKEKSTSPLALFVNFFSPTTINPFFPSLGRAVPLDVDTCLSLKRFIDSLDNRLNFERNSPTPEKLWSSFSEEDLTSMSTSFQRIFVFMRVSSFRIYSKDEYEISGQVVRSTKKSRQCVVQEQGAMDSLASLLWKFLPYRSLIGSGNLDTAQFLTKNLVHKCLELLLVFLIGNSESQLYMSRYFYVPFEFLGLDTIAVELVLEMMRSDEVLNNKIGRRKLAHLVSRMCSTMDKSYTVMLSSCCSLEDESIFNNQEAIIQEFLFEKRECIFRLSYSQVSSSTGNGTHSKRDRLETFTNDEVLVSWCSENSTYSAEKLFGAKSVKLSSMFAPEIMARRGGGALREIGSLLIHQWHLLSELCRGRNLRALGLLEPLFPKQCLLGLMGEEQYDDKLRGAACSLFMTLYIDREPYNRVVFPRMTRTIELDSNSHDIDENILFRQRSGEDSFEECLAFVSTTLDNSQNETYSKRTLQFVELSKMLLGFACVTEVLVLRNLVTKLIKSLDRRNLNSNLNGRRLKSEDSYGSRSARNAFSMKDQKGPLVNRSPNSTALQRKNSVANFRRYSFRKLKLDSMLESRLSTKLDLSVPEAQKESGLGNFHYIAKLIESDGAHLIILLMYCISLLVTILRLSIVVDFASAVAWESFLLLTMLVESACRLFIVSKVGHSVITYLRKPVIILDLVAVMVGMVFLSMSSVVPAVLSPSLAYLLRGYRVYVILDYFINDLDDVDDSADQKTVSKEQKRYKGLELTQLEILVGISDTIQVINEIWADRNVSVLVDSYQRFCNDGPEGTEKNVQMALQKITSKRLLEDGDAIIFFDLIMYENATLTAKALDIIINHHMMFTSLLDHAHEVQLLSDSEKINSFVDLKTYISKVRQYSKQIFFPELFEVGLDPYESITNCLVAIEGMLKQELDTLVIGEKFNEITWMQNAIRHLGGFELLIDILYHIFRSEGKMQTLSLPHEMKEFMRAISSVLCWLVRGNIENQKEAFKHLDFFLQFFSCMVGSEAIVEAIFYKNATLMKACPIRYISFFVDEIKAYGRYPEYLVLAHSICSSSDATAHHFETIRVMTLPGNIIHVMSFNKGDSSRLAITEMMHPWRGREYDDVDFDSLPAELQYHMKLLSILSWCCSGNQKITTIEARVQAIFDFKYLLSILKDEKCLMLHKTAVGLLLFDTYIDVELKLQTIALSESLWNFFLDVSAFLGICCRHLVDNEKLLNTGIIPKRQMLDYMVVCIMIVNGYFDTYYNTETRLSIEREKEKSLSDVNVSWMASFDFSEVVFTLLARISTIYDLDCKCLSVHRTSLLKNTLKILNMATSNAHSSEATLKRPPSIYDIHRSVSNIEHEETVDNSATPDFSFEAFCSSFLSSETAKSAHESEMAPLIDSIYAISNDSSTKALTPQLLVSRIVDFLRESIAESISVSGVGSTTVIKLSVRRTMITSLRLFRTMIEQKWGMTIYERDDDGGQEQDDLSQETVDMINDAGGANLCIELIAPGVDQAIQIEAIKLCIALLFKEGGALKTQQIIATHLKGGRINSFIRQVITLVDHLTLWHTKNEESNKKEVNDEKLPTEFLVLRLLQLMSEGHFLPNQRAMCIRCGTDNSSTVLERLVSYLELLGHNMSSTSSEASLGVISSLTEFVQGPCTENQLFLALETDLIEITNRLLRESDGSTSPEQQIALRKASIELLQGILEAQEENSGIYVRMLSVIQVDMIEIIIESSKLYGQYEDAAILETECLVLLEMFYNYKPDLRRGRESTSDVLHIGRIEVLWLGRLQKRFFYIPTLCHHLSQSTKEKFVEHVDRTSLETKLIGLLKAAQGMYREMQHQELLEQWNLKLLVNRRNQGLVTWTNFYLCCLINVLGLVYFTSSSESSDLNIEVNSSVLNSIFALQFLLFVTSLLTCLIFLGSLTPVVFQSNLDAEMSPSIALFWALLDPYLMYYVCYLVLVSLSLFGGPRVLISFLLLDIVMKNSVAWAVVQAVVYPSVQLAATFGLMFIILFIHAFFQFVYFRGEDDLADPSLCSNLFSCFKEYLRFGITGDLEDEAVHSMEIGRFFLDLSYYICMIIVLNIIKGITVDTFVELRSRKEERLRRTTEFCFICGLPKLTFNKLKENNAWNNHITQCHNMWNYLFFIIYLWEQDRDDDDGLELYVRGAIEKKNIAWFPMLKSLDINSEKVDNLGVKDVMQDALTNLDGTVGDEILNLGSAIDYANAQILSSLMRSVSALDDGTGQNKTSLHPSSGTLTTKRKDSRKVNSRGNIKAFNRRNSSSLTQPLSVQNPENDMSSEEEKIELSLLRIEGLDLAATEDVFCEILLSEKRLEVPCHPFFDKVSGNMSYTPDQSPIGAVLSKPYKSDEPIALIKVAKKTSHGNILIGAVGIELADIVSAQKLIYSSFGRGAKMTLKAKCSEQLKSALMKN